VFPLVCCTDDKMSDISNNTVPQETTRDTPNHNVSQKSKTSLKNRSSIIRRKEE